MIENCKSAEKVVQKLIKLLPFVLRIHLQEIVENFRCIIYGLRSRTANQRHGIHYTTHNSSEYQNENNYNLRICVFELFSMNATKIIPTISDRAASKSMYIFRWYGPNHRTLTRCSFLPFQLVCSFGNSAEMSKVE